MYTTWLKILISKFMTSQPGSQTIAMHILIKEIWSVIEYKNIRNIFLKKSYTKWDWKTIPRPFSKASKLSIAYLRNKFQKFSKVCFFLYAKLSTIEIYWD